ncbi:hypothetical protein G7062_09765 [Erysipelothrix sp. HDW6C]|uniref:hypothetical protein n=1 Tax=Erysipelothrix sp. HDW6C TaxID=2714930 RepID=UPI00140B329D|nr:hypothetical protein [Erysipelothrix sp. HDW6C]QIK70570.1 hypothetical protein G7062_09765 [Erysipelothrix sp. HDW6C]
MGKVDTTGIIRKSVRLGDYVNTTTETYRVKRTGKLDFNDLVFKAIDKKSMDIITGVYPFDLKTAEPFTMDYLSGTLAEKRQFEKEAFEATTRTSVRNSLTTNMVNALRQFDSVSNQHVAISDEDTMWEYTLLPVWLFTYDFENNPYYFAMNGQTGKIFGRVPLDSKRARKQTWLTIAAMAILGFLVAVI